MKKNLKRTLSLILSVAMVFTLIPLGTVFASAASSRTVEKSTSGDFKFVVPETIYLYPDLASSDVATSTGFQYYINETTDYAVSGTYDTTGKIYFNYANASGATLSWSFVDTGFNTMSGGSVTASATSLGTSATVNITGGTSPSLAAGTQGCYIQWCISYTDTADNVSKKAYNYTYVYKPFIRVVASGVVIGTGGTDPNWAGSVTWISGMNSFTSYHTDLKSYDKWDDYKCGYTGKNFASFISKNSTIYANGTAVGTQQRNGSVGTLTYSNNATNWYVVNTSGANGYYLQQGGNSNPSFYYAGYDANSNCNYVTGKYKENNKDISGCVLNKTIAELKVDTSRYSNLSQIPNLAIGLTVTNDETSDSNSGTWYIADASDKTFGDAYYKWHDDENYYGDYNTIIAGQGTSKWSRSCWEAEGIRYVGQWYRDFKGSTGTQGATATYYVHGYYANSDKSWGSNWDPSNNTVCQLRTTYYNKANLRTAIKNAELAMAKLGVNNVSTGYIKSAFFDDDSNYKWTEFRNAYRAAIIGFTTIGNTSNMDSLATNLNNALNALCTKVTLNANGGSQTGTTSQYVTIGKNQTVSVTPSNWSGYSAPTRTGYTFKGWSTSSTGTGTSSVTVGYNNIVYAIWEINQYYFDLNGVLDGSIDGGISGYGTADIYMNGSRVADDTTDYYTKHNYNTAFEVNDIKATEGHTFDGVDTNNGCGKLTGNIGAGDLKVFLKFHTNHYNINFNGNGATGGSTASKTNVLYTDDITLPNGFTKSSKTVSYNYNGATSGNGTASANINYTFAGWAKTSTGNVEFNGTSSYSGIASKTTDNETITLYAKWNRSSVTLPTPTRTGYTFGGWYSDSGLTSFVGNGGASYSPDSSVNLYAKWTNDTFYLAYNGNKPTTTSNTVENIPGNTTLTYNTAANLGSAPSLTGYIFGGWYEDSANEYKIGDAGAEIRASKVNDFYDLVGKNGTKTAYAKWTPITYKVAYNGNTSTSGSMSESSHTYDVSKNLTANAFLKTGYSFQGWATTAGGNVVYGDGASVKNLTPTNGATVTLYAKWNPNTITLNFNGNGSTSGSVNNQVFTYDAAQNLNENKFAKAYTVNFVYNGADGGETPATKTATFSFDGWNSATDGKGSYNYADKQSVTNPCGVSDPNGSATIYAKWTGGEITLPVPTRFGYSFVGWFKNADCSGNDFKAGGTGYTPANNNETFYAKWTPNDLTVKYSAGGVTGISVPADQKFKYDGTVTTAAPLTKNFTVTYDYNGVTGSDIVTEATPSCAWTGWYCVNCDKKFAANTTYEGKDFGVNAGDIFLTANWSTAEITLPSPTRPGYTFDGWYEDEDPFKTLAGKGGDKYIHDSDITLHAKWTPHTFTVTYDANGMNPDAGTMPTVSVPNGKLTYDTAYSKSSNGLISALIPKNDTRVFVGWNSKADGTGTSFYPNTECTAEVTDALYVAAGNKNGGSLTLYAIWEDISDIDDKSEEIKKIDGKDVVEYGLENEEYPVFKGLKYENGEWVEQYEEEALTKYSDATAYTTYQTDADAYYQAKNTVLNTVTKNTADDFVEKLNDLRKSVTTVEGKLRDIYTKYFTDGFEITYPGEATKICKASGMNLNHYTSTVLNSAVTALTNGGKLLSNKITSQLDLNACVKALANAFVSKAGRETAKPTYKVFETSGGIKSITGENIDAVNYVYTGKGNYTYYCYTNSTTPTIDVLVDETGSTTSYPTRSTVTSTTNSHFDATTKKIGTLSQAFSDYISAGVGGDYQGEINGETYTGSDYYTRQSFVKLNPTLTNARQEAVYQIASTDDSFNENVADTATLYGKNKAATDIQELSGNNTAVTPEGTITVVICYKGQDGFDVTGSQVNMDAWLSQYHLTRTSGGASTWEYIKENDSVYTIDDPTYGQLGNASFTYTFVPGKNIASADLTTVIDYIKNHYADIKKETFTGTNAGGEGLGYKVWNITASNSWSFNYYPKAGSFTYVHLVDRWGNVVDKVIPVPQCLDSKAPKVSTASSGVGFVIEEEGGSGIQTMSVNAKSFDIIADESAVLEGKTYSSADGTVRVYTGEANKSYTLNCTDAAGNSLKTTVKSDADGYLTISVEDKEYSFDGDAYTFTLNGYEINLYSGVKRHIKSAEDVVFPTDSVYNAEIITDSKVTMVQFINESGTTKTITSYTDNGDGTRTWVREYGKSLMDKTRTFSLRVKVGGKWIDEGVTTSLIVLKGADPKSIPGVISSVSYEPSFDTKNVFTFVTTNPATYIQVIDSNGNTRTYSATNSNIKSLTCDDNGSQTWSVEITLPEGNYKAIALSQNKWQSKDEAAEFTVKLLEKPEPSEVNAVYSYELDNADAITCGKHTVTVVTDKSVSKVQLMSSSGSTTTYTASNAVIEVVDGKKIWTFEKNFTVLGSYSYKIMTRTSSTKFADSGVSIDVTVLS